MERSALRFSTLTFGVPGAMVQLAGTYDLRSEQMDFTGELLTDASLGDMTSGVKSVLARMAQPFFRRPGGGSKFPIRISGTRDKPSFGLDVRKAFSARLVAGHLNIQRNVRGSMPYFAGSSGAFTDWGSPSAASQRLTEYGRSRRAPSLAAITRTCGRYGSGA